MRKGISAVIIVIIIAAIGIAAFSLYNAQMKSIDKSEQLVKQNQQENPIQPEEQQTKKEETGHDPTFGEGLNIQSCGDKKELFTTLPLVIDDFTHIVPLGNLAPSAHVFPTQHLYFSVKKFDPSEIDGIPAKVPVYAPSDMVITEMSSVESKKRPNATDYAITFYPCKEFKIYFDHVRTVSPKIKQAFDTAKVDFCNNYGLTYNDEEGPVDWNFCKKRVNIEIKEGEQIGTAGGGLDQRVFDFGAFDYRIPQHVYANAERWEYQSDSFYTVCALDYFSDTLKAQLKAKLGKGERGELKRTIEPICGTTAQDIPGTVQGTWVPQSFEGLGPENPFLALVHDNLNPQQPVFSVGLSVKTLPRGLYYFNTHKTGLVNKDFGAVTSGNVYCYEKLWTDLNNQPKEGIVLIQLLNEKTLKIEWQNQANCNTVPWKFTGDATVFER